MFMGIMLKIDASVVTNKGNIRSKNEDNFYLNGLYMKKNDNTNFCSYSLSNTEQQVVFAVCDGMGGEELGEEASFLAVQALHEFHKSDFTESLNIDDLQGLMDSYVKKANTLIFEQALALGKRMGTTLASLVFCQDKVSALNIGDSRVYLLRNSNLTKLTTDHTEAERLIRLGLIDRDSPRFQKSKNILTRYLGVNPVNGIMEADYSEEFKVSKGDVFLLCSDGLSNPLSDEDLKYWLSSSNNSAAICKNLIDMAISKDGTDNVTALVVKIIDIVEL
jgi:serine/threonine protein phosphatase PrpC